MANSDCGDHSRFDFVSDDEIYQRNLSIQNAHNSTISEDQSSTHSILESGIGLMSDLNLTEKESNLTIDGGCLGKLSGQYVAVQNQANVTYHQLPPPPPPPHQLSTTPATVTTTTTRNAPTSSAVVIQNTVGAVHGDHNVINFHGGHPPAIIHPFSFNDINHQQPVTKYVVKSVNTVSKSISDKESAQKKEKIPIDVPKGVVSEYACRKISLDASPKIWKSLGNILGLKQNYLDAVELDYNKDGCMEQFYKMLLLWRESNGTEATYHKLGKALLESNQADVVKKLMEYHRSTPK